ncbi:CLUMA_CG020287, isoform A [Clunio marinus]|uniref:CLUMA_CG020287, isoform A n=1 Tax=Clunio marinus TaxID=568069 RepID=A0A1J1J4I2_9DIPT|nr:CLUMA_CG020287, isoform A [Clunio marinus]
MENNGEEIVNEQVLSDFRNQWRQELNQGVQAGSSQEEDNSNEAKTYFLQGVDLERKGKCFDAIRLYRRAIQLDPDIEYKIYSQSSQQKQKNEKANSNTVQTIKNDENTETIENLAEVFQRDLSLNNVAICESNFGPGVISTNLHISCLPVEVFLVILKWLVSNDLDIKSLERFGRVCKGFYLLSRDQEIWKLACTKVWGSNISPSSTWREMFMTRSRVNFNGCYISKINYQRYGENSFQDQFYRPLQIVEYFRLIRFLPNGSLLMMTSADDLQMSVNRLKNISNALQSREIMKGQYHYQDSTVVIVIKKQQTSHQKFKRKTIAVDDNLTFFLELDIHNTVKKKFSKLTWKHYEIIHCRNGEELNSEFDLRSSTKYPPFYFSQKII